ncbi:MAG: type II toxin-antitoxin system PemK/MazF family toxin [Saprospiraceae bacterium]|nr:type II toxin-antitoxin system PemK/MazF family toxin [Saprospiraceae bacterium]
MKRCEILIAGLNPVSGKEQQGKRPVVIISGNAMNDHIGLVIVCPLTSKIKNFVGDIFLHPDKNNGLENESEVLIFQLRTISKSRLINRLGFIRTPQPDSIIENLNKILKY